MKSINEVNATGRIIATGKDRRGYSTVTMVIRGRRPAIIRFVIDRLDPGITVGDSITVKGHTKAYSYHNEIQDRWTSVQYFVADEIKKNETEIMEKFGVEGHYFKESSFRAYFSGTVSNKIDTKDPKWGKLTVKVDGVGVDQRPSYVTMSYFKSRRLPAFDYEKGEEVCVVTSISTPQKEFDGRTVNFENLIIEDIVKVGEEAVLKQKILSDDEGLDLPNDTDIGGEEFDEDIEI